MNMLCIADICCNLNKHTCYLSTADYIARADRSCRTSWNGYGAQKNSRVCCAPSLQPNAKRNMDLAGVAAHQRIISKSIDPLMKTRGEFRAFPGLYLPTH